MKLLIETDHLDLFMKAVVWYVIFGNRDGIVWERLHVFQRHDIMSQGIYG